MNTKDTQKSSNYNHYSCRECKRPYKVEKKRGRPTEFCSMACRVVSDIKHERERRTKIREERKKIKPKCKHCNKPFERCQGQRYCCVKCRTLAHIKKRKS